MPNDERMTIDERYKYLRIRQEQYHKASRQERSELLDHMQQTTGLNRKTLIRHMKRKQIVRKSRRRQRGKTYGAEVDHAVWVISESLDHICAERLTPHLSSMAQHLAAHGELQVTVDLLEKLGQVSVSTVGRRLKQLRRLQRWHLPRRQGPRSSNPVTRSIPMKRIPWDEHRPGHFEVDLVHHCGPTSSGHYVHTMQMIDVATGWSERVAVLGRSQLVMEDASYVCGAIPSKASNSLAPDLSTRTTTASSNRRMPPWSAPTSAIDASTPSPRLTCSTVSTTRCGFTTTSSSR
jgi:hypothetical protein